MAQVDLNAVKNRILLDDSLDPVEKVRLMNDVEAAARTQGSQVSIETLVASGLTALAAWIASRFLGFGAMGQGISAGLGAVGGYNFFR